MGFWADITGATWRQEVAAGMHKEYIADLNKATLAGIYDPTRFAMDEKARRAAIAAQEGITTKEVFEAEERDRQAKIKTLETEAEIDKRLKETEDLQATFKKVVGIVGKFDPIVGVVGSVLLGLNKLLPEMSPEQRVRYEETKAIQDKYSAIQSGAVAEAKIRQEAQEKATAKLTKRINSAPDISSIKSIQTDINADPYLIATDKNTLLELASNKGQKIRAAKPVSEPLSVTAFETESDIFAGIAVIAAIIVAIIVIIVLSGG